MAKHSLDAEEARHVDPVDEVIRLLERLQENVVWPRSQTIEDALFWLRAFSAKEKCEGALPDFPPKGVVIKSVKIDTHFAERYGSDVSLELHVDHHIEEARHWFWELEKAMRSR